MHTWLLGCSSSLRPSGAVLWPQYLKDETLHLALCPFVRPSETVHCGSLVQLIHETLWHSAELHVDLIVVHFGIKSCISEAVLYACLMQCLLAICCSSSDRPSNAAVCSLELLEIALDGHLVHSSQETLRNSALANVDSCLYVNECLDTHRNMLADTWHWGERAKDWRVALQQNATVSISASHNSHVGVFDLCTLLPGFPLSLD